MKTKTILAAAVLTALVDGYQGFAATPITGNASMPGSELTNSEYVGSEDNASLTVIVPSSTEDALILADMNHPSKTFKGLNAFIVNNSPNLSAASSTGVIEASSGYFISFDKVKNINLGSADNVLNNAGPVIHGFSGSVSISGADNLNIYADGNGIMAQRCDHPDSTGAGLVDIQANNINIHTNALSVHSAIFKTPGQNDVKDATSINLDAKDSVYIESTGDSALWIDDNGKNGNADISIKAGNNIDIIGNMYGSVINRNGSGQSTLNIISTRGNVTIQGAAYGFFSGAAQSIGNIELESTISGKTVNIGADKISGVGVYLNNTRSLKLQGDTINISGAAALNVQGGSQLTIGDDDGTTKTDVNLNGYARILNGGNVNVNNNTTIHVDSKYLTENTPFIGTRAYFSDNKPCPVGDLTMNQGSSIVIDNIDTDPNKKLWFSDNSELNNKIKDQVRTNNLLQDVIFAADGKMIIDTVDKAEAAKLLGGFALTNVALYATENNMDGVTALITNNASDTDAVKAALNSVAGLSGLANVAHGTYTMNGLFSDAVSGYLINRQDQDVWAYGFHSKENVNGLSFGADYDAQYNGIAAGVDLYKNGGTTAGVALTYGDSNVSGSNGLAATRSDADYYGASIYGRFDRGSYALLGDISYMKGDHDVTQQNSNTTITASPDSDSISVGVKALKDYAAGENGTLTPYVGLRYLRLSTDDFTASNGLHYVGDDQDMVIIPVGVNYTASISHGKWSVRPYAGIGYVWTAGDRSADQTVMLGGKADSFSYDTADSSSFIARVGVTTDCDDMSYGIGYSWQKGDSVSNNAWTVSASYHF